MDSIYPTISKQKWWTAFLHPWHSHNINKKTPCFHKVGLHWRHQCTPVSAWRAWQCVHFPASSFSSLLSSSWMTEMRRLPAAVQAWAMRSSNCCPSFCFSTSGHTTVNRFCNTARMRGSSGQAISACCEALIVCALKFAINSAGSITWLHHKAEISVWYQPACTHHIVPLRMPGASGTAPSCAWSRQRTPDHPGCPRWTTASAWRCCRARAAWAS